MLTHPDAPEQFARVRRAIEDVIDKQARQVFVEGLVLEIGQQGIEELGVQWQCRSGSTSLQWGTVILVFVSGMMSRMLSRLKAGAAVKLDKLAFFEGFEGEAFKAASGATCCGVSEMARPGLDFSRRTRAGR